jgi:O-antigen/teichoic acid export membrane protein
LTYDLWVLLSRSRFFKFTALSLFSKLIRGASVNVLEHAIKVLIMFFTTPLMIQSLGKADYGTWLLAVAIIAYFQLLDLGISFAGSRFLGTALGSGDRREYRSLICNFFLLYNRIGIATIALTVVVVCALPLFINDPGMVHTVRILVAGFGSVTALRFFTRIFEIILKSHVRYDLIGISSITKTVLQGFIVIWMLVSGYGLIPLLVAHILIDVFDQLLLVFFAKRVESQLHLRGSRDGEVRIAELLRYSASSIIMGVSGSLRQGIDPLVITHMSGVTALPVYNVGIRFLGVLSDVVNAIFGGNFMAAFSQLSGRGDAELLNERFLQTIRYSAIVAALGGCGLMMFGPAFIARWVGPDFVQSGKVLWILTPAWILALSQYPLGSLLYSQNKQHHLTIFALVMGIFNLLLSLFLATRIGWIGVVWATSVEMLIGSGIVSPLLVTRAVAIKLRSYYWKVLVPAVEIAIASTFYYLAVRSLITPEYDRLIMLGCGFLATHTVVIWFVLFTKSERGQFLKFIRARNLTAANRSS